MLIDRRRRVKPRHSGAIRNRQAARQRETADSVENLDIAGVILSAAGGLLLGYGAALLSGYYPLGQGMLALPGRFGKALALVATAATALLVLLLLGHIFVATGWAPALIAAGLALLGGPLVFQALPSGISTGALGLTLLTLAASALCFVFIWQLTAAP